MGARKYQIYFSCWTWYLTRSLRSLVRYHVRSLVRYHVQHWEKNLVFPRTHVLFSLYNYSAYRKIQESLCMFYTAAISALQNSTKLQLKPCFHIKNMAAPHVNKSSRVCIFDKRVRKCGRNWQIWYEISYFNYNIWFGNVYNCLPFKFRFEDITKF
jgi:hypothetical protein